MTSVPKSEIRESTIQQLEDKVRDENYGAYLRRMTLKKVRGFRDQVINFDFPVTAIVGPNGGGKTTVLGAAAILYKDVTPRTFFAKSGKYDESMADWAIEYDVIDKNVNPRLSLQRTASFSKLKWNRKAVQRSALTFGVTRTVPATERRELTKAIGNSFEAKRVDAVESVVLDAVASILGRAMKGCNRLTVDTGGRVTMFTAETPEGHGYSEFHFGAGEASVIRIVASVEAAADNSIIFIEEIENGLHPVATRRMVEYLIEVARRKSCQVIFTTHSNDALSPLPSRAIWACIGGELIQGKLDIRALRTIVGQVDARLAIFVEDSFAEDMVAAALRYGKAVELDIVKIHGMGGADPAVKVHLHHNRNPVVEFPSLCLIDGDRRDLENHGKGIWALPSDSDPEAHVFNVILEDIDRLAARLAVGLQLPSTDQGRVKEVVKNRAVTNRDMHVIFAQIGEDLDFTAELVVRSAFLSLWAQERPDEVRAINDAVRAVLAV